ncbi:hypothetical protein ACLKA7_001023 [Drosophila subpalustris]
MDSVHLTLVLDTPNKKGKSSPADLPRNQRSGYKASLKVLKGLEGRSLDTLTAREIKLKKKHEYNVRRFESGPRERKQASSIYFEQEGKSFHIDPEEKFTVENWLKLKEKINQALYDAMSRQ